MLYKKTNLLIVSYTVVFISLFIYSFSQIDLNLTLSSNSVYQSFQNLLIQLGYFNRPLSTSIFLLLISTLFILYFFLLWMVKNEAVKKKQLWFLIGASVVILFFSYPAFSHDFFNYIFDARILVKYGENLYIHKALDYPFDLWTRFMRWTHRTYPYGPLWIIITTPFYIAGAGKLTLTMVSYKLLFIFTHLGNIFFIKKIMEKINSEKALFAISFYALNPLILIEGLVSPHLDSLMLLFLLIAIYVFVQGKKIKSLAWLAVSAGIKFITGALLPLFLIFKKDSIQKLITYSFWIFLLVLIIPILQREPYPWYFIPAIGLAALSNSKLVKIIAVGVSIGTLLRYAPFLYFGDYGKQTEMIQLWITIIPILVAFLISLPGTTKHLKA